MSFCNKNDRNETKCSSYKTALPQSGKINSENGMIPIPPQVMEKLEPSWKFGNQFSGCNIVVAERENK